MLHVPPDPAEEQVPGQGPSLAPQQVWGCSGSTGTLTPRHHPQQGVDGDASVHDRVLWALHISGMDDLLKFLASAQVEQQWALHVLEIISLMFRDQVSWGSRGSRVGTPAELPQC